MKNALRAAIEGNRDKALHHTISSAAALINWHEAIAKDYHPPRYRRGS